MSLESRQQELIREFSRLTDWEAKYRHIIEVGKRLPPFPEELRREDLKVKGCQSQVWLHAERDPQGKIVFVADADAVIVRGLVAMLLRVYSDATPEEILATAPTFIETVGLGQNLSPSRANGLLAMVRQIKYYAAAFKALGDR